MDCFCPCHLLPMDFNVIQNCIQKFVLTAVKTTKKWFVEKDDNLDPVQTGRDYVDQYTQDM